MIYIFIINIHAGQNKGYAIAKIIQEYCISQNINYLIHNVHEKEDTKKIIDRYKECGNAVIYSVGGDGTLNEVVNCIAGTNLKLNVIPAGTGNDFYKSLVNYKNDTMDLGKVNDKYFINVASFGIDADIANTANILKTKNVNGNFVYPLGIIKNYLKYKPINIEINDINKLITILTICNAGFYGGGFNIAPNCNLNDGFFDVYEVGKINKLKIIKLFYKLMRGIHINDKNVKSYKTDKIKIDSIVPINCNIDGEILVGNNFSVSICKDAINLDNDTKITELLKSKRIIK